MFKSLTFVFHISDLLNVEKKITKLFPNNEVFFTGIERSANNLVYAYVNVDDNIDIGERVSKVIQKKYECGKKNIGMPNVIPIGRKKK